MGEARYPVESVAHPPKRSAFKAEPVDALALSTGYRALPIIHPTKNYALFAGLLSKTGVSVRFLQSLIAFNS